MRPNSLPVEGADLMVLLQRDGSPPVDAIDMHPVAKGVDVDPMRLRIFDPIELGCQLRRHAPLRESAISSCRPGRGQSSGLLQNGGARHVSRCFVDAATSGMGCAGHNQLEPESLDNGGSRG